MRKVRSILTKIFKDHPRDFNVRIWDGRVISWGETPRFTLVFRDKRVFQKIILNGNALVAGAAFIENKFDIEGDIFAAVRLGDYLGSLRLGMRERLGILTGLLTL